jgi:Methyltransferase domain/Glycosyl transferases group 1
MNGPAMAADSGALRALLIPELEPCLWYPERLVWPNSWAAHIPFAFWIVSVLRPRVIVELGVHTGNSYAAFCQGVKQTGISASCFGVDTWRGDEHAGFYGDEIYEELLAWHEPRYANFSKLVRSTFDEAVEYFSPGSVDLLHIDGLHTYEAVQHDFETWLPLVSSRGIVMFHDTNVRQGDFGVWRFWEELTRRFPAFEFLHGHGLGVLGVGADLPPSLTALFETAFLSEELRGVRDLFARLGTPLMRDVQLDAAEASVVRATEAERAASAGRRQAEHELAAGRQQVEHELKALREEMEREVTTARKRAEHAEATAASESERATAEIQGVIQNRDRLVAASREEAEAALQDATRARAEAEARLAAVLNSASWRGLSVVHVSLTNKPRLRRFIRTSAKIAWWTFSLQLHRRLIARRSALPALAEVSSSPSPLLTLRTQRIELGTAAAKPLTAATDRPLVVCLSHISPHPSRAGNEYRLQRILAWLDSKGWDVVLLYCPLSGQEPDDMQLAVLAGACTNLICVHRDGKVLHSLVRPDLEAVVEEIDGRTARDVARLSDETSTTKAGLMNVMRSFCPDALIEVMCVIDEVLTPEILLATYVFMTRGLPLLRSNALKIVDTIDVFSSKSSKTTPFGIENDLTISEAEEAHLLSRTDLVLAIQPAEAAELQRIAPNARVLTVGVDMKVDMSCSALVKAPIVLLVASGNPLNAKGLRDFLRFAWPRVRQAIPNAALHVVGSVGSAVAFDEPGVMRLGQVDDLGPIYGAARAVINPAVAGTGIKIKTLEALAHLRPLVTWPSGLDGVSPELRALCRCVTDWYAFSEALICTLTNDDDARKIIECRERIIELLSPHTAFAELDQMLTRTEARAA